MLLTFHLYSYACVIYNICITGNVGIACLVLFFLFCIAVSRCSIPASCVWNMVAKMGCCSHCVCVWECATELREPLWLERQAIVSQLSGRNIHSSIYYIHTYTNTMAVSEFCYYIATRTHTPIALRGCSSGYFPVLSHMSHFGAICTWWWPACIFKML